MADQSSFLKPILLELTYGASSWKKPVKVVATSNVTQSGTQTIDGVALAAEDEVLCVGQTSGAQNGVFLVASGAWTRRTDCDTSEKLFAGCRVPVTHGTHAEEVYRLVTTGRINVGVTAQSWELDTPPGAGTGDILNGGNTFGASMVIGTNDAQPLIWETNNTERLRVLSTGEVGINTATPGARLHVNTGAASTSPVVRLQTTAGNIDIFVAGATPEGAITGSIGDLAIDQANGLAYIKATGTATNTGWQALTTPLTAFVQGGNPYGAPAVLGSTDDEVQIITGTGVNATFFQGGGIGLNATQVALQLNAGAGTGAGNLLVGYITGTSNATGAANSVDFQLENAAASNTRTRLLMGGNTTAEQWSIETDSAGDGTHDWSIVDVNSGATRYRVNATGMGFFGVTPVARPAAYTQTYSTSDRTLSAYTADVESGAYTGIDNTQGGTPYAQLTDLNALRVAYENLRAFTEDLAQLVNAMLDDDQVIGLKQ